VFLARRVLSDARDRPPPATRDARHAELAGVQKAPRHEVAGELGTGGQRALWGFDASADLEGGSDAGRMRPADTLAGEIGSA
jgi:hypothetical protein